MDVGEKLPGTLSECKRADANVGLEGGRGRASGPIPAMGYLLNMFICTHRIDAPKISGASPLRPRYKARSPKRSFRLPLRHNGRSAALRSSIGLRSRLHSGCFVLSDYFELRARRKPMREYASDGSRPLRYADRQRRATRLQPPPRYTRCEPSVDPIASIHLFIS